jgi:hypothetical protein
MINKCRERLHNGRMTAAVFTKNDAKKKRALHYHQVATLKMFSLVLAPKQYNGICHVHIWSSFAQSGN